MPWQQSLLALAWKNKQLSVDPLNLPESHAVSTPAWSRGVRQKAVQGQPWTRTRWEKIPARDRHPSPCSSVSRGCLFRESASDALATRASTEITMQGGVCLRGMKGAAAEELHQASRREDGAMLLLKGVWTESKEKQIDLRFPPLVW